MTVYLLHFERPIGNERHSAQHYLGSTSRSVRKRVEEHRATKWTPGEGIQSGHGACIMGAVNYHNIPFQVAKTWKGGRSLERKLKNTKNLKNYCPICNPNPRKYKGVKP